jgi:hypothetical protein
MIMLIKSMPINLYSTTTGLMRSAWTPCLAHVVYKYLYLEIFFAVWEKGIERTFFKIFSAILVIKKIHRTLTSCLRL